MPGPEPIGIGREVNGFPGETRLPPGANLRALAGAVAYVPDGGDAVRDAARISHLTMKIAASGPMTKRFRPNTWMPPNVEISM